MKHWQDDDDRYDDGNDDGPWRAKRTKFRPFEDQPQADMNRIKRSGKRSHRQKTIKDDYWDTHDR